MTKLKRVWLETIRPNQVKSPTISVIVAALTDQSAVEIPLDFCGRETLRFDLAIPLWTEIFPPPPPLPFLPCRKPLRWRRLPSRAPVAGFDRL